MKKKMTRKEYIGQVMNDGLEKEKEAIRRAALAAELSAGEPASVKKRQPRRLIGILGAVACTAALVFCLAGRFFLPKLPTESTAPPSTDASGGAVSAPVDYSFTVSLRYVGGEVPLTDCMDIRAPYIRYFWADEEETEAAVREAEEAGLGSAFYDGELPPVKVYYYQEGFRQRKNFVILRDSWISITGENLQSVQLSCGKSVASYSSPSVYGDYRDRYPEADLSRMTELVMEEQGITSYFQLPWRKKGMEITLNAEQLEAPVYTLELAPYGDMWWDMLYKDGYSYDNWADTVEVTATFTDGSVQRKAIHITYTAEGGQILTLTD